MVDRALAVLIGVRGVDAQIQQRADQRRRRRIGQTPQAQRVTAPDIDGVHIGAGVDQRQQRWHAATAHGFEKRGPLIAIAGVNIGPGAEQDADDPGVSGVGGFVQRAAPARVARIGLGAMLEQQLHAGRVVFVAAGRRMQRRQRAGQFGFGAAFQQKARKPPVAGGARQRQRTGVVAIERVDFGAGIAQQRGYAGVGAARGMVQRRIALSVGGARVRAVGQQGHHRFRTAVPAVAGGGDQRCHPGVRGIEVDTVGDQAAQQAQIRQHSGQHRQRALIAGVDGRQRMRIRAAFEQGQRAFDPALTRGVVQRRVQIGIGERRRSVERRRLGVFGVDGGLQQRIIGEGGRRRDTQQRAMRERPRQCAHACGGPAQRRRHQFGPGQQQHAGQR